jgi:hypothetical protein
MAQERVQIRLDAIDNTKRVFRGIEGSLGRMRQKIFSLQSLFATLGAGFVLKSFLDVGSEVENLRLRFNFLFGDVTEGKKAFDGLVKFASKVPFTLQEIAQASGNLAVVSKDAEQLTHNLKLAGNIASVTGLDFRTVGEQLQRSFSSGISSADLFRERGVNALLGFKAGARTSVEDTIKKFEEVFGEGGRFGRASEVLGTTLTGTLSMLQDKLFKFKLDTSEAGIFDFAKASLKVINDLVEENEDKLKKLAQSIGTGLVSAIKGFVLGIGKIYNTISGVFSIVGMGIAGLVRLISSLPDGVREFGILGFLLLGGKGKALVLTIGFFIDKIRFGLGILIEGFGTFNVAILETRKFLSLISKEELPRVIAFNRELMDIASNLKKPYEQLNTELSVANDKTKIFGYSTNQVQGFFEDVEKKIISSAKEVADMNAEIALASANAEILKEEFQGMELSLKKISETLLTKANEEFGKINETIATGISKGIKDVSQGIAESIVLGKQLSDTFREMAQKILINVLAKLIEEQLLLLVTLGIEKLKTSELYKQYAIRKKMETSSSSGIFGSIIEGIGSIFGGGGATGGGGGGGGYGMAEGGSVKGGQPITVGERGREMFIPSSNGTIIPNHQMGGTTNVNFTIQANDVRGIKELLIDNRATITNIVNQALNSRGKSALI